MEVTKGKFEDVNIKEYITAIDYYEKILGFTEEEVEKDFEHMNQYYHKLMDSYPDSLAKTKEKARKNCDFCRQTLECGLKVFGEARRRDRKYYQ